MYIFPDVIFLILGFYALVYFFYKLRAHIYAIKFCKFEKYKTQNGYCYLTDFGKFFIDIGKEKLYYHDKNNQPVNINFTNISKIIVEYSNNPSIKIPDSSKLSYKSGGNFYWYNIIICDSSDNLIPLFTAAQSQVNMSWRMVQVDIAMLNLLGWYNEIDEEGNAILDEIMQDFKTINANIKLKRI